jgi:hypothetical protein
MLSLDRTECGQLSFLLGAAQVSRAALALMP